MKKGGKNRIFRPTLGAITPHPKLRPWIIHNIKIRNYKLPFLTVSGLTRCCLGYCAGIYRASSCAGSGSILTSGAGPDNSSKKLIRCVFMIRY